MVWPLRSSRLLRVVSLVSALLGWTLALFVLHLAWDRFATWRMQHQHFKEELHSLQSQLQTLTEERAAAEQAWPVFRRMIADQLIGPWAKQRALDRLEATLARGDVQAQGYRLAAAQPLDDPSVKALQGYQVFTHPVEITVTALHEGRVIAWLAHVIDQHALSSVERCEISRQPATRQADPGAGLEQPSANALALPPPLDARCTLTWYQFVPSEGSTPGTTTPSPLANLGGSTPRPGALP